MKHKHCDLIKAWADGAEIQVERFGEGWKDAPNPHWYSDSCYRIKPKTIKYRVGLYRDAGGYLYTYSFTDKESARITEGSFSFIKWLSDWQEVVVE